MLNKTLLKQTIKSNYKILLIFIAVLTLYVTMIVGMYDPEIEVKMGELLKSMPEQMLAAFGFNMTNTSLIGFISSYLYGFLMLLFPMLFEIIVANRIVAKQVDVGSMAFLLATPNKRAKIILTKAIFLIGSVILIITYVTVIGIICSESFFKGKLDIEKFIQLNIGVGLLHFAISGISFFASCNSNDTKNSLAFGAGIPIGFYLIQMLANMGGEIENLKYVTIFTLFSPEKIISGEISGTVMYIMLGIIGITLYTVGIIRFCKRDLPL